MTMSVIQNLIVPFVMLLVGTTLKKHPVKDMRNCSGYLHLPGEKAVHSRDHIECSFVDSFCLR